MRATRLSGAGVALAAAGLLTVRYNADQVTATFATRLKESVDLASVEYDLTSAVQQALEPAHVSIWISQRDR